MKITLINPPIALKDIYGKYSTYAFMPPPIGLCSLAGYLIKYGYDVTIIDANPLNLSIDDIIRNLSNDPPTLIGIYTNTASYYVASLLVYKIKEVLNNQKIVAGGPHVTFLPKETLCETPFDYGVIGEGEKSLLELVRQIEDNSNDFSSIKGIVFRNSDNQITINEPRTQIEDLDELPFPAVHLLPPLSLYKPYLLQNKRLPFMTMMSARGCPHKCIFCKTPFGRLVRYHSPEYMIEYIKLLIKDFGVKEICFCDDTFTLKERRVIEFCYLLQKENIDISWYVNARVDCGSKEMFKEMKKTGCWLISIGVESGDDKILKLLRKAYSLEQVVTTSKNILDAGLLLKAFFILGSPGETLESIEKTIRFAKSLKPHFPVFSLMTPYPGTELWEKADYYGKFDRSFHKLLLASTKPAFIPNGLTEKLLLKKQKEAFRRLYLDLGMVKRHLLSINSPTDIKKLFFAALNFLKINLLYWK